MAEYSNLSATINAQIRANGVQAITGPVLNAVLTAMVNVLGDGYRLAGVAHPADNPGSPDNRVAYLAAEDGTYTNFGGLTVSGEVALLLWDSAWTKAVLVTIDSAVTPGSDNLITSGAVDSAISALATAYMQLVPGATGDNLASFAAGGQVKDSGIAAEDLVVNDGIYADLFAGFAGNLVDTRSAGTRQGPFAFRQSGGDGVNYMTKILGKTEVFNQLANTLTTSAVSGLTFTTGANGYIKIDGTAGESVTLSILTGFTSLRNHNVIYGSSKLLPEGASWSGVYNVDRRGFVSATLSDTFNGVFSLTINSGAVFNNNEYYFQLFDLTLQGLGLTTAAAFQSLHPLPYYNYNAGVLKNNAATSLQTVGFNAWDEDWENGYLNADGTVTSYISIIVSKNYIPVVPNTAYYVQSPALNGRICFYDAAKNCIGTQLYPTATFTTPAGAAFIKFDTPLEYGNTYKGDICINRSDASRNGIYEPYWKKELSLGLNSIPCHDENNNAVTVNGLDGVGTSQDELIVENGWGTKIIKRRGRRAYQAGDESDATLMTDGTNTDYPLATPKVLTLDNPIPALIEVDNLGTEKRLPEDTADNPQAPFECDSNYSVSTANLVRLLGL